MKKFFYGCLILLTILSVVLILSGCNLGKSTEKSQASIKIPDAWLQLKSDDFSIYLPDSWEGGSAQELATIIATQIQITPPEATNSDKKSLLVFWAYDTASFSEDIPVTFNAVRVTSDISSLKDYMDKSYKNIEAASKELGSNCKIVEQQILKMAIYEQVARTITYQEILGNNLSIAQYIIKDSTTYWILTFSAAQKDFDVNIDVFDRAIQTTTFK
jgi:hypothetical protein